MLPIKTTVTSENKLNNNKIGLFWGTFDPPTLAHASIIENSINQLKLSRLIVVINDNEATGKIYKSPGPARLAMLLSMVSQEIKDRLVIIRQTNTFSLSYNDFKKEYPDKEVYAIVGQDSFERYGKYFAEYDHIIVVPRGKDSLQLQQKINDLHLTNISILEINKEYLNTSSTLVREAINSGQNDIPSKYTHPSVNAYVKTHGFFKEHYTAAHHESALTIQRAWRSWIKQHK